MMSRRIAIGIMVTTLAVLPGCMTLGPCGRQGEAQPCSDRVSPAATGDVHRPQGQTVPDAVTSTKMQQTQATDHASTMMPGLHGGPSTGMVILGVVLMVVLMAVMM